MGLSPDAPEDEAGIKKATDSSKYRITGTKLIIIKNRLSVTPPKKSFLIGYAYTSTYLYCNCFFPVLFKESSTFILSFI